MKRTKLIAAWDMRIEGRDFKAGDTVATLISDANVATLGNLFQQTGITAQADGEEAETVKQEPESEAKADSQGESEQSTTPGSQSEQPSDQPEQVEEAEEAADLLVEAGIKLSIAEALRENAERLGDDRLTTPDGIRQWVREGGDLESLEKIGLTRVKAIKEALGL